MVDRSAGSQKVGAWLSLPWMPIIWWGVSSRPAPSTKHKNHHHSFYLDNQSSHPIYKNYHHHFHHCHHTFDVDIIITISIIICPIPTKHHFHHRNTSKNWQSLESLDSRFVDHNHHFNCHQSSRLIQLTKHRNGGEKIRNSMSRRDKKAGREGGGDGDNMVSSRNIPLSSLIGNSLESVSVSSFCKYINQQPTLSWLNWPFRIGLSQYISAIDFLTKCIFPSISY